MARTRSPSYPVVDLETAVDLTVKLEKYAQRHPVPAVAAIEKAWGMKAGGSYGFQCVAALRQYGLIQEEGTSAKRHVRLSDEGAKVVHNHPDRPAILRAAAIKPKVHAVLVAKYPGGLPPDDTVRTYLLFDHQPPFNPQVVAEFISQLRKTLRYAGVDLSAIRTDNSAPLEEKNTKSKVSVGELVQWENGGVLQFAQPRRVQSITPDGKYVTVEGSPTGLPIEEITVVQSTAASPATIPAPPAAGNNQLRATGAFSQDVMSLGAEGQVILQWPEKLSKEAYEEVADWLRLQLKKIARLNGIPAPADK